MGSEWPPREESKISEKGKQQLPRRPAMGFRALKSKISAKGKQLLPEKVSDGLPRRARIALHGTDAINRAHLNKKPHHKRRARLRANKRAFATLFSPLKDSHQAQLFLAYALRDRNKKSRPFRVGSCGDYLLFRFRSTIGVIRFNFSVRPNETR